MSYQYAENLGAARRFEPTDLSTTTAETPELLLGLVYRGHSATLFGPTGSAKTLLALALTREARAEGLTVSYWDEELGAAPTAARLRALGATDAELAAVRYYAWQGPTLADSDAFADEIRTSGADLVIFDPLGDHLVAAGASENDNAEFTAWARSFPQRLSRDGVASLLIDGAPHADGPESGKRGGRQRGATQKGYKAAIVWRVEVADEPSREHVGLVKLVCTKDRFGSVGRGAELGFAIGGDGAGGIVFERREAMARQSREEQVAENRAEWIGYVVATLREHAPSREQAISQLQLERLLPPGRKAWRQEICQVAATSPGVPAHNRPGARGAVLYWFEELTYSHVFPPVPVAAGTSGAGEQVPPVPSSLPIGEQVSREQVDGTARQATCSDVFPPASGGQAPAFDQFLADSATGAAWSRVRKSDGSAA